MTCVHWLKGPEGSRRVVRRITSFHPRVMSRPLLHATLSTSSPSLSSTSPVSLSSSSPNPDLLSTHPLVHCEDLRRDGTSTEIHSSTGYEPKRIELNRILVVSLVPELHFHGTWISFFLRFSGFMVSSSSSRLMLCPENARAS